MAVKVKIIKQMIKNIKKKDYMEKVSCIILIRIVFIRKISVTTVVGKMEL